MTAPSNLPDHYRGANLTARQASQPAAGIPDPAKDRLDLRFLFNIFRRRLKLFATIVGFFFGAALAVTLTQPKLYKATAEVVMNEDRGEIVPDAAAKPDSALRSEEIDTQIKIIKSQKIAEQVVDTLRLQDDAALRNRMLGGGGLLRRLLGGGPPAQPSGEDLRRRLADGVLSNLTADRMETAYALRISYTGPDPKRAADIANAFARAYSDSAVNDKRAENEKALALLRGRIDELRNQAQADFKAAQDFRVKNDLLSAQATQLAEQQAQAYGQQLAAANAANAAEQGKAGAAEGAGLAAAVNSPVIQSLRAQRAQISVRIAEMTGRYLDTHPDLINARRELADVDTQIAAEIARVRSGVRLGRSSDAQASAQQVGSLKGNLAAAQARLAASNEALVGLDDLSRKAQASQSLYDGYLSRYKEILAQAGTEKPVARLLTSAKVPLNPISPSLVLNLALGLVVGALLGAGAAIAAESAFAGMTTGDDVENRLGVRYLGGVPLLSSINLPGDPAASIAQSPDSPYAEAIRGLLGAVRSGGAKRSQVIAVTSALPGEGKTALAASIVRIAARAGETAIVIDCDLMRHTLSALFDTDKDRPGLREVMRAGVKLGDAMVKDAESEAMILPVTTRFEEGERLLERGNFHRMIAMMREHFDVIVLDTAPILPVAETREIVGLADAVVVSCLWRQTSDSAVRAALRLLPDSMAGELGIALNRIDMKKQARFGSDDATYYYAKYEKVYGAKRHAKA